MICHERKLIFVHLRRTAGNSIEAALGGIVLFDRWFRRTGQWDNRLHRGRSWYKRDLRGHRIHATAADIRSLYPGEFGRYFRFSIVRNPWKQMASLYGRLFSPDTRYAGFRAWLRRFDLEQGTVPRASLFDDDGRCLVDFIGRFERLQQDFDTACDLAGLPRCRLPQTNDSGRAPLSNIYDVASRSLVERIFRDDIERFGYTFEDPTAARSRPSLAA
jgi:hypothetical protein